MKASSSLFLLVLISLLPCATNAYASRLQCNQDLNTEEVVMNYRIKDFEEAYRKVILEFKKVGDDDEEWSETLTYAADSSTLINVRLRVPEAISKTQVQFHIETSSGAAFTAPAGAVVCNGKRSFSRNFNAPLTLEIKGDEPSVKLIAGWATGHSSVSLTRPAVLLREGVVVEERTSWTTELSRNFGSFLFSHMPGYF